MNTIYHCCRWCKWFILSSGMCVNDRAFIAADDIDLHPFYEDGHLSEAIREGFNDMKLKTLEYALLDSRLSKKRIAEILKVFRDELDDAIINWTERIDDTVSTALNNYDFACSDGIKIANPDDFYCKHYR